MEAAVIAGTQWVPMKWLDDRFARPAGLEDVMRAYVEARLAVAHLVRRFGMAQMRIFLQALSEGVRVPEAFDRAFAPLRWSRTDQSFLGEG